MTHELTVSQGTSDYLAALSAEANLAKARADAAQGAFLAALTVLLRERDITVEGPIGDLKLDGNKLSVTLG